MNVEHEEAEAVLGLSRSSATFSCRLYAYRLCLKSRPSRNQRRELISFPFIYITSPLFLFLQNFEIFLILLWVDREITRRLESTVLEHASVSRKSSWTRRENRTHHRNRLPHCNVSFN